MARLLRLLPDSASPHEPRSGDPSKIAFVALAAMANQAKPLRGVTPSRRSKVCRSGRSRFTNWALAHVRPSGGPTSPTQRLFRVARSFPNLCARPSLTRSNRRGTDPYARWCGRGGVARRPPIPINPNSQQALDRLHSELGIFQRRHLPDAVLREAGCGAADRAERGKKWSALIKPLRSRPRRNVMRAEMDWRRGLAKRR